MSNHRATQFVISLILLIKILRTKPDEFNEAYDNFDINCAEWKNISGLGCQCIEQNEIYCVEIKFTIDVDEDNKQVNIYCEGTQDNDKYNNIPAMNLTHLSNAVVSLCQLQSFSSNNSIFKHFGLQNITSLIYIIDDDNSESSLFNEKITHKHFNSLTNLKFLELDLMYIDRLQNDFFIPNIYTIKLFVSSEVSFSYFLESVIYPLSSDMENKGTQKEQSLAKLTVLLLRVREYKNGLESNALSEISNLAIYNLHETELDFRLVPNVPNYISNDILHNFNWTWFGRPPKIVLVDKLLANLINLKSVRISNLYITYMPEDIFFNSSNIVNISFANNHLKSLPMKIFALQRHVIHMDLSDNFLSEFDENLFIDLSSLSTLRLSNNNINNVSR